MRVAEGVIDRVHPAIRQEVVVDDDAPLQIRRDVAALFAGAIEGESPARRGVQPMQLAGDTVTGLVEAANRGLGDTLADSLVDLAQFARLPSHPGDEAGRTDQRRAEQIAQRLRGAILGDQLLNVEIDRRRLDALAILGRRDDALGKSRSRFTATVRAAMDRRPVFGHLDHALGKVEHLPFFRADHRTRVKPSATMAAKSCGALDDPVGVGDLAKRIAPVALLTAARLARAVRKLPRMRGLFFNPSLDGGFELLELSNPSRRRSSAFSARSASISRFRDAISSSTSEASIPPLSQKTTATSPPIVPLNPFPSDCDFADSPWLGSYCPCLSVRNDAPLWPPDAGLFSSLYFISGRGFPLARMCESIRDNPNRRLSCAAITSGDFALCPRSSPGRRQAVRFGDRVALFHSQHGRWRKFLPANA